MKISVIVPLYKGKKYISNLLDLFEKNKKNYDQNHSCSLEVELVFINDYPDETIGVINNNGIPYKMITHDSNQGIHASRIDGLKDSTGEYVLFFDQDDSLAEDYLSTQLDSLEKNNADWVICNGLYRINRKIYNDEKAINNVLNEEHYFRSLTEIVSPGQVVMKRSIIPDEWCEFILKRNYCDDAYLWMLLKNKRHCLTYNKNIAYFHHEDNNNTSFSWNENATALRELKDLINKNKSLNKEYLELFNDTVDKEISKQVSYGKLEKQYSVLRGTSKKGILQELLGAKETIIYGYGVWGRKLFSLLKLNGIEIDKVCDKNIRGEIEGVFVEAPENVFGQMENPDKKIVIITAPIEKRIIIDEAHIDARINCITLEALFESTLEE